METRRGIPFVQKQLESTGGGELEKLIAVRRNSKDFAHFFNGTFLYLSLDVYSSACTDLLPQISFCTCEDYFLIVTLFRG